MRKLKVYISSTFMDLKDQRKYIIDRIQNYSNSPLQLSRVMEKMLEDGSNISNIDDCIHDVESADIYILLVGERYGSIIEGKHKSYTEIEYDTACNVKNKKYLIYKFDLRNLDSMNGNNSDLEGEKKIKFQNFTDKVFKDKRSWKIANHVEFVEKVNESLSQAITTFVSIAVVKLKPLCELNLNREFQHKALTNYLELRNVERENAVAQGVGLAHKIVEKFNFTCENGFAEDDIKTFSQSIKLTLNPNNHDLPNKIINWFNMNDIAHHIVNPKSTNEGLLNVILHKVCLDILGIELPNGLTFETFYEKMESKNLKFIESKYIGFMFECDNKSIVEYSIKLIDDFCNKLESTFTALKFDYNIVCFICFLPINEVTLNSENTDIGKLTKIRKEDLLTWVKKNDLLINNDADPLRLVTDIFENIEEPQTYLYCKNKLTIVKDI